jgi:hypothetical protein
MLRSLMMSLAALGLGTSTLSAAIIIHEPYNGYTAGSIVGQAPNANTTGLNTSGVYAAGGGSFTFNPTGLTFGSGATTLETSGGSLSVNNGSGAALSGPIALSSAYTGTLYSSFLYRTTAQGTSATGDVFRQSISSSTSSDNQRFRIDPISGNNSSPAVPSDNVAGAYLGSVPTNGTGEAAVGTTYLFLGRFTNVGGTLSVDTPGEATIYMLTEAQFNNFKLDGLLDAELDAATVGSSITQVAGKATASATSGTTNVLSATGLFYQVASLGNGANLQSSFDELRYGDSYDAVTPIPEPTTISLVILGGLGLLIGKRRRA